jgi:NhaC family Na+:H+ antiporter
MAQKKHTLQLLLALSPLVVLMLLLWFNVGYVYGDDALSGSNQVILLVSALVAGGIGVMNGTKGRGHSRENQRPMLRIQPVPSIFLILIGGLAGTWLVGGIVPAMIYYGLGSD